jgi:hypothetical protein
MYCHGVHRSTLYQIPFGDQTKKNEMDETCGTQEERRGAWRVLVQKYGGKISLGRPWHRWEYNIKTDFQEMGWEAWTGFVCLKIMSGCGIL